MTLRSSFTRPRLSSRISQLSITLDLLLSISRPDHCVLRSPTPPHSSVELDPIRMAPNAALNSLLALGIPPSKALFALSEHGNEVEAAADWCWGVSSLSRVLLISSELTSYRAGRS